MKFTRSALLTESLATLLSEQDIKTESVTGTGSLPCLWLPLQQWSNVARLLKREDVRLVATWASQERQGFTLHAAYARTDQGYALLQTTISEGINEYPSITPHYVAAARMERIIHDMFGLVPSDHPDLRPWIKHEHWPEDAYPLRKEFTADTDMPRSEGRYPFVEPEGEGVYEIPVGPVHAGIIEPGHFRFLAVGEQILNLEQRFGYVHKGIEKGMEGRDVFAAARLAARISGDATVAHSWAFCSAIEQAAGIEAPPRAVMLRAVMCERERMANHIGDIGAICNDAAWGFMHMQCQRLREEMARLHEMIFGHRLLMDLIIPGGVHGHMMSTSINMLTKQTMAIAEEIKQLYEIYEDNTSIRERVIDSGTISHDDAIDLGLLGVAGRSTKLKVDARNDAAYPPYDSYPIPVVVCPGGDVAARLWVRFKEIQESARFIENVLAKLPDGPTKSEWEDPETGRVGFAVVESWRGEIATWVRFGSRGRIERCYSRDPSMINWLGLELAVRQVPVPDFPLNNKSFNCSYSGHDL